MGVDSTRYPRCFESAQKRHRILFEPLKAIAKDHGYAFMAKGSLARDLDYLAVPWIANPWQPLEMVERMLEWMRSEFCPIDPYVHEGMEFERKWHGRLCYVIHVGAGVYIDLQVIEPRPYGLEL